MGYPVINFHAIDTNGVKQTIKWYPSEYLFLDDKKYCLAADQNTNSHEVLFGSTLMRQNNIIFDVDNKLIGMARATCNSEETMIMFEQDYHDYGNSFGLELPDAVMNEVDVAFLDCDHKND